MAAPVLQTAPIKMALGTSIRRLSNRLRSIPAGATVVDLLVLISFTAILAAAAAERFSVSNTGVTDSGNSSPEKVDPEEVDPGEVQAGEVQAGEVQAGEVEAGEVEAGKVETGEVAAAVRGDLFRTLRAEESHRNVAGSFQPFALTPSEDTEGLTVRASGAVSMSARVEEGGVVIVGRYRSLPEGWCLSSDDRLILEAASC
jgi:hypothetical protein